MSAATLSRLIQASSLPDRPGAQRVKEYSLECHGGGEALGAPDLATFSVERDTAAFIVAMSAFAREHDLHRIERCDNRVTWLESADDEQPEVMLSECTILCIDNDSFWYRCYRKHGDHLIETETCSIAELAAFHGLAMPVS